MSHNPTFSSFVRPNSPHFHCTIMYLPYYPCVTTFVSAYPLCYTCFMLCCLLYRRALQITRLSSAWKALSMTVTPHHQTTCGSTCWRTRVPLRGLFPSTLSLGQPTSASTHRPAWTMRHGQSMRCVTCHCSEMLERIGKGGWAEGVEGEQQRKLEENEDK